MRNTNMTPAQPQQDLGAAPSGIVLAPPPVDYHLLRKQRQIANATREKEQTYSPEAIGFAAWCLMSGPRWWRDIDTSAWAPEHQALCARLNTRPFTGLGASYFKTLNGYIPRDLKGVDAYLFRIYMRVWQERVEIPRSTAQRRLVLSTPQHQVNTFPMGRWYHLFREPRAGSSNRGSVTHRRRNCKAVRRAAVRSGVAITST